MLNAHYGIHLPEPSKQELQERGLRSLPAPTAEELLGTYCVARSVLAPASGVPDYQRAARTVVGDYATGRLLYCVPPPSAGTKAHEEDYHLETLTTAIRNTNNAKKLRRLEQSLEVATAANSRRVLEDAQELDDFDSILDDLNEDTSTKADKRGKSHKVSSH